MTPFGQKLREIRQDRGLSAKAMAAGLGITPAYLSALEHGQRGKPNRRFVHRVCQYLGIIWDDAEELQRLADLSHPRVTVDTSGLSPKATELAKLRTDAWRRLGICCEHQGKNDEALAAFKEISKIDPLNAACHVAISISNPNLAANLIARSILR